AAAATHAAETDEPDALTEAADATTTATLEQRKADALVALARTYLDTEPSDRTGEDRHLVIVELNADTLTAAPAEDVPAHGVPAGTPTPATPPTDDPDTGSDTTAEPTTKPARVPAGTSQRCGILGAGPLETRTVERLACNGKIALKVTDAGGRSSTWAGPSAWPHAPNAGPCACAIPPVCSPAVTRPRTSMPTTPPRGPTADPPTSTASPCSAAATTSWSTKAASTWPRTPSAPAPTSPASRSSTPPATPSKPAGPPCSNTSPCTRRPRTRHPTRPVPNTPTPLASPPPPAAPASTSPTASTPCCTTSSNSPPDSTVYLLKPAVSPLISWRRPAMYSARIGSAESITAASTAGMFTVNSPW